MSDAERIKILLCDGKIRATLTLVLGLCDSLDQAALLTLPTQAVLNHLDRLVAAVGALEFDVTQSLDRLQADVAGGLEQKA